ncbi:MULTISPECIES: SDR family oxidoreductase [Bacillus]|uniref:Sugar epimerase n=2 Tax=Bacillus TaxID=1386 RepID=A0A0M4FMT0_9BACI|nr:MULTISPECIES: SDR family oxidoreductase [Bacillus]ALC83741.1 sugar epimerase [Bacillus gobiensis]MBP1083954.1 uncharacterized protein YbjT (DUF2867 family) [Bacillus capparidis]MED1096997.1 SDR family oxidoreductase [Bacillus capparidis]
MNVLIIGANGQIGRQLTELLHNSKEHQVTAMVRKKEQAEHLKQSGINTVISDLEESVESLTEAAGGSDAIIFTAGSGGTTGYDKTLLIDLDGAAKTIEAAEKAGIERFIMISALQSHVRENWNEAIKPYYAAKHYADKILEASSLNYTIIRPGRLLNDPGTGQISAAADLERNSIPREDVAKTALVALNEKNTYRKAFDLVSGNVPIADALKEL